eukprot:1143268-Pelagomonas_calceolata.AAC.5
MGFLRTLISKAAHMKPGSKDINKQSSSYEARVPKGTNKQRATKPERRQAGALSEQVARENIRERNRKALPLATSSTKASCPQEEHFGCILRAYRKICSQSNQKKSCELPGSHCESGNWLIWARCESNQN